MDLENIRLLLHVLELGSVHGAARRLNMSRSLLRRRLESLEAAAGCELFVANAAGVGLTPAGAVIAKEGRLLLEQNERMLSRAKAATPRAEGVVRLVIPVGMPVPVRSRLTQALRTTSPGLRVHEREVADPIAHLHEPFELMFHFGPPPAHGEWFSRTLRRLSLVPLASEGYLEAHGRPASPRDLEQHTLLSWRRPGADPRVWPRRDGGTLPVDPVFVSDNLDLLHRLAAEGVGIFLGPSEELPETPPAPLVPLLADAIGGEDGIRVLSPRPVDVDPRLAAVLDGIHTFLSFLAG